MCWFIWIEDYPSQPNRYGHYSGAGRQGYLLRGLSNRRAALRNLDKLRRGSVPPDPWDDYWTSGRICSGWGLKKIKTTRR